MLGPNNSDYFPVVNEFYLIDSSKLVFKHWCGAIYACQYLAVKLLEGIAQ